MGYNANALLQIAVFLAALDTVGGHPMHCRTTLTCGQTIITTAVPTIAAHYKASQADYTWIGSSFLLAAAAATPIWGKLSDIWGRKPILLLANAIFFVGSLIAALSTSIKMLLAGRVIQGVGGGGLLILANICISDLFSMRYVVRIHHPAWRGWGDANRGMTEIVENTLE